MLLNLQQETQENTVQQQQQGCPLNEKEMLTSEYNLLQVYLWQKSKLYILLTYTTEKIQRYRN